MGPSDFLGNHRLWEVIFQKTSFQNVSKPNGKPTFCWENQSKSAIKTVLFELARSQIRVDPFLQKVEFQKYVVHIIIIFV